MVSVTDPNADATNRSGLRRVGFRTISDMLPLWEEIASHSLWAAVPHTLPKQCQYNFGFVFWSLEINAQAVSTVKLQLKISDMLWSCDYISLGSLDLTLFKLSVI